MSDIRVIVWCAIFTLSTPAAAAAVVDHGGGCISVCARTSSRRMVDKNTSIVDRVSFEHSSIYLSFTITSKAIRFYIFIMHVYADTSITRAYHD